MILLIALVIASIYMVIQFQYLYYWKKIKPLTVPPDFMPSLGVTIIIVARNEAETITACLQGLLSQSFPKELMEIILIDDHSTDETVQKINSLSDPRIQLLHLSDFPEFIQAPAYKKSGITLGVSKARNELIIVTDADCIQTKDWLKTVDYAFEKSGAVFQTSPVLLWPGHTLLEQMQEMEMLAYMLITGSGIQSGLHDIANGANMAFTKSAFQSVDGYAGNYQYASGDDMFLIEKMRAAFPDQINFAKSASATILTHGKSSWSDLLKQRKRWASKNKGLHRKNISLIWSYVGIFHFTMFVLLLLAIFHFTNWWPFLVLISFKWVADYFVIQQAAYFFKRISILRNFILLQFLFTWYILRLSFYMLLRKQEDWKR